MTTHQTGIQTFGVSYTFGKEFEANHRLNDWNFFEPLIHELDNLDKPQNVAFHGVWDLPIGKDRRFFPMQGPVGGVLLNGWSFDRIFTYTSGYSVESPTRSSNAAIIALPIKRSINGSTTM